MHLDISDEQVLDNAGIRVTAVRLLIWRKVRHGFSDAFSLADLEAALPTVDRSTLFRTLTLLSEAHLLHDIDDGGLRPRLGRLVVPQPVLRPCRAKY